MCEGWQGLAGALTSLATTQRNSYETIMYAHRISLYTHYRTIYTSMSTTFVAYSIAISA